MPVSGLQEVEYSRADAYPMPMIEDILNQVGNAKFITMLDLTRGYWQGQVAKEDRYKTAFTSLFGLYQFSLMPFGLSTSHFPEIHEWSCTRHGKVSQCLPA